MPTQITGTSLTVGSIDLTTPLATADGGTGSSTISPYQMVLGTAQATTSGTSIDFTGIPSWVKRITVMLNGVSTNGTSDILMQTGAGSVVTSGYGSSVAYSGAAQQGYTSTVGFILFGGGGAVDARRGIVTLATLGSNIWVSQGSLSRGDAYNWSSSGSLTLGGTLDRIRLTTVNGTDTFDAGSVNLIYEGY